MPEVELLIGSILVTIEQDPDETRLEYRDLLELQNYSRYPLSCFVPNPSSRSLK